MAEKTSIADVIAHAQDRNVTIPKNRIDFMAKGIESQKVSADYLCRFIDKVAERKEKLGYDWYNRNNPQPGKAVAVYGKGPDVQAYVLAKTNSTTKENYYEAIRLEKGKDNEPAKHIKMSTDQDLGVLQRKVDAYMTAVVMNGIDKDNKLTHKPDPTKSPSKALETSHGLEM